MEGAKRVTSTRALIIFFYINGIFGVCQNTLVASFVPPLLAGGKAGNLHRLETEQNIAFYPLKFNSPFQAWLMLSIWKATLEVGLSFHTNGIFYKQILYRTLYITHINKAIKSCPVKYPLFYITRTSI